MIISLYSKIIKFQNYTKQTHKFLFPEFVLQLFYFILNMKETNDRPNVKFFSILR